MPKKDTLNRVFEPFIKEVFKKRSYYCCSLAGSTVKKYLSLTICSQIITPLWLQLQHYFSDTLEIFCRDTKYQQIECTKSVCEHCAMNDYSRLPQRIAEAIPLYHFFAPLGFCQKECQIRHVRTIFDTQHIRNDKLRFASDVFTFSGSVNQVVGSIFF